MHEKLTWQLETWQFITNMLGQSIVVVALLPLLLLLLLVSAVDDTLIRATRKHKDAGTQATAATETATTTSRAELDWTQPNWAKLALSLRSIPLTHTLTLELVLLSCCLRCARECESASALRLMSSAHFNCQRCHCPLTSNADCRDGSLQRQQQRQRLRCHCCWLVTAQTVLQWLTEMNVWLHKWLLDWHI